MNGRRQTLTRRVAVAFSQGVQRAGHAAFWLFRGDAMRIGRGFIDGNLLTRKTLKIDLRQID